MSDKRLDGSQKGSGFFGTMTRPDGNVSSEISIGVPINGVESEIPSMVPTLTRDEVLHLLKMDVEKDQIPDSIRDKAVAFANQRQAQGKPYFATPGEQRFDLYPEIHRADAPSDVPLATSRQSIDPDALARLLVQRNLGK